jgi:hypothetical protein
MKIEINLKFPKHCRKLGKYEGLEECPLFYEDKGISYFQGCRIDMFELGEALHEKEINIYADIEDILRPQVCIEKHGL